MNYSFPTDIRDRIQARIDLGGYADADDVIREAIDALDQLEEHKLMRWNERNRLAIEQSERGLSAPLNDDKILNRLRQRLAAEGITT
jgi:Arc/MetJ-type ribon-helix-helix transcriptional regulator